MATTREDGRSPVNCETESPTMTHLESATGLWRDGSPQSLSSHARARVAGRPQCAEQMLALPPWAQDVRDRERAADTRNCDPKPLLSIFQRARGKMDTWMPSVISFLAWFLMYDISLPSTLWARHSQRAGKQTEQRTQHKLDSRLQHAQQKTWLQHWK